MNLVRALLFISVSSGLALTGCKDDPLVLHIAAGDSAALYAATNDPGYAGWRIELAPGTYSISKTIHLQFGQQLVGAQRYRDHDGDGVWDPIDGGDPASSTASYVEAGTSTILDGANRDAKALNIVAMAAGSRLEGVTVHGAGRSVETMTFPFDSLVTFDEAFTSSGGVRVTNNVVEGGSHGIGTAVRTGGADYTFVITGNVVRDNDEGIGLGSFPIDKAKVTGTLERNRITGGGMGFLSLPGATNSTFTYRTSKNIIDKNGGMGVFLVAGFSFGGFSPEDPNTPPADGNTIDWTSTHDTVTRNGSAMESGNGGVLLEGALDFNFTNSISSNNLVKATLVDTIFVRSDLGFDQQNLAGTDMTAQLPIRRDVSAVGGSFPFCGGSGNGNRVEVSITGARSDNDQSGFPCTVAACSSLIAVDNINEDTATNKAVYTATGDALVAQNHGLKAPQVLASIAPRCGS